MKRSLALLFCCLAALFFPSIRASAQIEIIGEVIKAAIMAVDLGVQKIQTETIVLQNAQKEAENLMQQTQLTAITDWVQRQKDLYAEYYQELWQVKNALSAYEKVKSMIKKQEQLVVDYQQAYSSIRQDPHFSGAEVQHIYNVYGGILTRSMDNAQQLSMVIKALITQMEDGDRLRIIDSAGSGIDKNYNDLQRFTQENIMLSLQRAKDERDLEMTRSLYGLSP